MIKSELRIAAREDSHRETYSDALIDRFIAQGENFIKARLDAYALEYTFTDADRSGVTSAVYTLPARVVKARYLTKDGNPPLDQVDENVIAQYASASPVCYAIRPSTLIIAGTPAAGDEFLLQYFGLPAALAADGDTNALLNDYQQLYIEATQIYIFKRAQDYESMTERQNSVVALITEINRKMKKQLGGARAAGAYNVDFRSSY